MPLPSPQGLYDPAHEHDACGLGFIARLRGDARHDVVRDGIEILKRLAHRGAAGSDPTTGDGAGLLTQIPDAFFAMACDFELPRFGDYAVAMTFLSRDAGRRSEEERLFEAAVVSYGQKVMGWRDVPVDPGALGIMARESRPVIRQLFVERTCPLEDFERTLFLIRKRTGRTIDEALGAAGSFYVASFSPKTLVYKGLMLPEQIDAFYLDLREPLFASKIAVVHSRFSTNTFPTWDRAHPFRRIAHNGEINTLRGNLEWMTAREGLLRHPRIEINAKECRRIIKPGGSDSASLDNVVDFLVAGGRSIPHVMMMLVPEAWPTEPTTEPTNDREAQAKRDFYEYHASLVEPWDGPAALVFTDGTLVGATLDRNGLRPLKYIVTKDGLVVAASELGVLDIEHARIAEKGRLQPGKMLLVDTANGRLVGDAEIKREVATRKPYGEWLRANKIDLASVPDVATREALPRAERETLQRAFGYTREDLRVLLGPMAKAGEEPTGSMGIDSPLAVLSLRPVSFFRYFKQQFAQVTNPPIDPIREELVMSLVSCVGGEGNLLDETPEQCRLLELRHPILNNRELAKLKENPFPHFRCEVIDALFDVAEGGAGSLDLALTALCEAAERAVDGGASVLVVSDRGVSKARAPIPSLLAVAAVHGHLLRVGKRTRTGLVVESAEPREVADFALLVGYGAGAVNPYLALETVHALAEDEGEGLGVTKAVATKNYVKAINKGLMKVMSKMGISCLSSYHGAQIFEAVGVGPKLLGRYFPHTSSRLGGIELEDVAREALLRHAAGFSEDPDALLDAGGVYAWRALGEAHLWSPMTVASLQKAVRNDDARSYAEYAARINDQGGAPVTLRALWDLVPRRPSVPLAEVEPAAKIVTRFATGAMSFGSISKEAHENLAIAMNRIGGRSNSGEGGEDEARFEKAADGSWRRSAVKQVASARFGASAHYLVNAEELQIKIAQGAKPGEGGQLPGHKVDGEIARVRHATPGVTLISPPPHHDIYSIEDLAQLIFDLKNVNPRARVSVKLVAESGVGTVAAGVAKARADAILISGHDGGTGASPLSSVQHAGIPWEIGLAEAQQVLLLNGLRSRVRLQVDGQLKTGRDVAIAALLGAEEFGFATAPLVASGCIMMRKCHLNTCPVGVATQDPVLRAKFQGEPEHVVNFMFFVAEELRAIMARLGFRTVDEMVGRAECIAPRKAIDHPKARLLDFAKVLYVPADPGQVRRCTEKQAHLLEAIKDQELLALSAPALDRGEKVRLSVQVTNADRALGAMLSGEIARRRGAAGLPEGTIRVRVRGTAGQSFGAFAMTGLTLELEGDANDYVGKGLSGGTLAIFPPPSAGYVADDNVIVGNTVLYGALAGRAYFAGRAGERFAVRNSGAVAVVEGVGDHGCEYMTGGVVLILGSTGRNFGAGMSGGVAYVLDEEGDFEAKVNRGLVELETLGEGEDDAVLRELLAEHYAHTGSTKAARLLAAGGALGARFVKVIPTEYKRVLGARKQTPRRAPPSMRPSVPPLSRYPESDGDVVGPASAVLHAAPRALPDEPPLTANGETSQPREARHG